MNVSICLGLWAQKLGFFSFPSLFSAGSVSEIKPILLGWVCFEIRDFFVPFVGKEGDALKLPHSFISGNIYMCSHRQAMSVFCNIDSKATHCLFMWAHVNVSRNKQQNKMQFQAPLSLPFNVSLKITHWAIHIPDLHMQGIYLGAVNQVLFALHQYFHLFGGFCSSVLT